VRDVRELANVVDREEAKIGVFISLEPHTPADGERGRRGRALRGAHRPGPENPALHDRGASRRQPRKSRWSSAPSRKLRPSTWLSRRRWTCKVSAPRGRTPLAQTRPTSPSPSARVRPRSSALSSRGSRP
jgi:hypothetical protein